MNMRMFVCISAVRITLRARPNAAKEIVDVVPLQPQIVPQGPQRRELPVHRCCTDVIVLGTVENPFVKLFGTYRCRVEAVVIQFQPLQKAFDVTPVVPDRQRRVTPFGFEIFQKFRNHRLSKIAKIECGNKRFHTVGTMQRLDSGRTDASNVAKGLNGSMSGFPEQSAEVPVGRSMACEKEAEDH